MDEHYSLSGVKYFLISGNGILLSLHLPAGSLPPEKSDHQGAQGKEAQEVYSLLISHDLQGALNRLQKMQKEASQERKKEIEELTKYILSNSSGLSDYREKLPPELQGNLRPLGAAEGNINRILAHRFQKRGMSWSKRGANS